MTALLWPSLGCWRFLEKPVRFYVNNWQELKQHLLRHLCSAMEHKLQATNVFLVLRWCGPEVCALQIRGWTAPLRIWRTHIIVDKSTLSFWKRIQKQRRHFWGMNAAKVSPRWVYGSFRSEEIFLNAACTGSPLARAWSTYRLHLATWSEFGRFELPREVDRRWTLTTVFWKASCALISYKAGKWTW